MNKGNSSQTDTGLSASAPPDSIFHFAEGLPAFEHVKEFIFMHRNDTSPFIFMQALGLESPSFVCIDPYLVYPGYQPEISPADRRQLHLERETEVLVLSIVTVTPDMHDMTANLQGPIILNMEKRTGKQIVSDGTLYGVRYRIWDALQNSEKERRVAPAGKRAQGRARPGNTFEPRQFAMAVGN